MNRHLPQRHRAAGFNLVEVAIALVIVGLLLTGGLVTLQAQNENQQIQDAQKILEDTKEALIGYAASHPAADGRPFLPCPDKNGPGGAGTANDGLEDRNAAGACAAQEGNLPWATLGFSPEADPWGNRLRYRVTAAFSNSVTGMTLASTGDMEVRIAAGGTPIATLIPAVVLSHGKNGRGARNAAGTLVPIAGAGVDELANGDGNTVFVSHSKTEGGVAFDDHLVWLPPSILFNRMLQAGRLP